MGKLWYMTKFPKFILDQELNIAELEMLNALAALRIFGELIANNIINLRCDNAPSVCILQSGRGRSKMLLSCARQIWSITAKFNIVIHVSHIAGVKNDLADELSRAHLSERAMTQIQDRLLKEGARFLNIDKSIFQFE